MKLRYRSEDIKTPEDEPFKNDKLGREPFVTQVTELLAVIQEPFVIALNAPWGSGKSTTFKLLEAQLKTKKITTVSFNAWEVDYSTDPLVPLVATLHERLLELQGTDPSIKSEGLHKFKTLGGAIAKRGAVAALKVATAGILDAAEIAEDIADAVKTASEDLTGDVIEAFKSEKNAAEEFRKLLGDITSRVRKATAEGTEPPPVVLLIDELDRCRPTFAVAMLERIKHFFSVPGLVFVLALDLEQLKASTRKVYGADMDAGEYLRRFIDLELRLPRADVDAMVRGMLSSCGADAYFEKRKHNGAQREECDSAVNNISALTRHFELTPRAVQRLVSRLMLVLRQTSTAQPLYPTLVVFLIFLRMQNEELLRSFVAGRINAQDVMASVRKLQPRGEQFAESEDGKLIEGYLVLAQVNIHPNNYREKFIQQAREIEYKKMTNSTTEFNPQEQKLIDIYHYYRRAAHETLGKGINIKVLDMRINLVSSDFSEQY